MENIAHLGILKYFTTKMVGIFPTLEYDEIFNSLWIQAQHSLRGYDPEKGKESTYLYSCLARASVRVCKALLKQEGTYLAKWAEEPADWQSEPLDVISQIDARTAIAGLPALQAYIEDGPRSAIAARRGYSRQRGHVVFQNELREAQRRLGAA